MRELLEANYLNLVRATVLLQSDQPRQPIDTIYLHGLSEGMIYSTRPNLFEISADYLISKKTRWISFNGSDGEGMPPQDSPGAAWPGKKFYLDEFSKLHVDHGLIPTGSGLHTRDEADKFIISSKEMGWKSGGILSVGYHCIRSMSCMVAAMETQNYYLNLHFINPPSTDPWYPMLGSQGVSETNTFTEITEEITRIFKYWERGGANPPESWHSGYGVPPGYLFHYLQYRDEIVDKQKFPLFPIHD